MIGEDRDMRYIPFLAALIAVAAIASPAAAADRNYSVTSFDRIRLDGPFKVHLTTNVAPFARATGSPEALDGVSLDVQGRTLVIHSNRSSWGGYPGRQPGPVEISVGTHELAAAFLNGSGSLAIDKIRGLTFELAIQGAGAATIANVDVDQLKIGITGAGSTTLAGKAPRMTAIIRGSSLFDASALTTKDVVVGAEGPVIVKVNAVSSAKIDATGIATVEITGNPACTVKANGSVTVTGCR
jgi:Putative auto-transporter adhesin, head GIN domain